jgi:hypothetical protein
MEAAASPLSERSGNRCGHDPRNPSFPDLLRPGKGGHPAILSRALEKIRGWYKKPDDASFLFFREGRHDMRSEGREAILSLLEAILYRLELSSRYLGTPNTEQKPHGFIDVSMADLAELANLGQRRCERAMRVLMQAGIITSKQRRGKTAGGEYYGLRAIRQVEIKLFEILDMAEFYFAQAELARERLWEKAKKRGLRSLKSFFRRLGVGEPEKPREAAPPVDESMLARWTKEASEIMSRDPDKPPEQVRREVNEKLGRPADFHPGAKEVK